MRGVRVLRSPLFELLPTRYTFSVFLLGQVLHGSDQDVLWLQRDLGLYVVNMFDTGQVRMTLLM